MSETTVKPEQPQQDWQDESPTAKLVSEAPSQPDSDPASQARKKSLAGEIAYYLISAVILGLGVGLFIFLKSLAEEPKDQPKDQLIPLVSTTTIAPFAGQLDMVVSGTVVPYREIRVAAEVSGNVIKKYPACEAGNFVRKGDKLLEIDPEDYKLQLDTRMAELQQSQRMLEEAKEELDGAKKNLALAERDFVIAQAEFDRNQKIRSSLSSAEFDQSKRNLLNVETTLTTRKNNLSLIEAKLSRMESAIELSRSQVKRAELNLEKSTIVAPDDGIIVSESVQEGEFVNLGTQLLTFEDTRRSEVICNLSPRDLEWIRTNSPIDAQAQAKIEENKVLAVYYLPKTSVSIFEPEKENIVWQGVLERFDGIGRDNRSRMIPTRITIAQPVVETGGKPHALVRGMYVKCRIEVQVSEGSTEQRFISFPEVALRPGNFVWVVDRESKLKKVPVTVVDRGERVIDDEVKKYVVTHLNEDALKVGDRIVTSPIPNPKDDLEVRVEGAPPKPAAESWSDETAKDNPSSQATEATNDPAAGGPSE